MTVLCDTDILSVFAKVERLDLLHEAFPGADLVATEEVYDELRAAEEAGFAFPPRIFEAVAVTSLTEEEARTYVDARDQDRYFPLSTADLKTFIAARERDILLLSNDAHLLEVADQEEVLAFDIYDIFRLLYTAQVLAEPEARAVLAAMEAADHLVLPDKDRIFQ